MAKKMSKADKAMLTAVIIIAVIAGGFYLKEFLFKPLVIIPSLPISFAGFTWDTEVNNHHSTTPTGSCSGSITGGEIANLQIQVSGSSGGAGCEVTATTQTPINAVDEFLIIFDSTQFAGFEMGSSTGFFVTDKIRISTRDESNMLNNLIGYGDAIGGGKSSFSQYFAPKLVKLKNNFDGTYSILTSLGVGDVFILKETKALPNKPLYLALRVNGGGGAGGDKASVSANFYNIVRKENAFAVCKADEVIAPNGTCQKLANILLASEEAIKESFDAKLIRVTAELEAKNIGLTNDITLLKQQLQASQDTTTINMLIQRLNELETELKTAKQQLADVQAKDKTVVNTIILQEKIKESDFIQNPSLNIPFVAGIIIILFVIGFLIWKRYQKT